MALTITQTATVIPLLTKDDMTDVLDGLAESGNWFGTVSVEQPGTGPAGVDPGGRIWKLNVYGQSTAAQVTVGSVAVTDNSTFLVVYASVADYNTANPDNQLPGGS